MSARIASALLVLLSAAIVAAQTPPPPPTPSLPAVIVLQENGGGKTIPVPFTGDIYQIDGRSNVDVKVTAPNGGAAGATKEGVAAAADLRVAVDNVSKAYDVVTKMLLLPDFEKQRMTNSDQWNAMAAQASGFMGDFAASAQKYVAKLKAAQDPELRQHAAVFEPRLMNVLTTGDPDVAFGQAPSGADFGTRKKNVPDFLELELKWINDWITRKSAEVSASAPQLYLAATMNHKGTTTPVGLSGYNDIPIGPEIAFKPINLTPSPEEIDEIKKAFDESEQLAKSFNELKESKADLRKVLLSMGIDFTALQTSLVNAKAAIKAMGTDAALQQLGTEVGNAIKAGVTAAATPQQKELLADVQTRATNLINTAKNARTALQNIEGMVDMLRPAVVSANLQAQADPVDALVALLRTPASVIDPKGGNAAMILSLRDQVVSIGPQIQQIQSEVEQLTSDLNQLPAIVRTAVKSVVEDKVMTTFSPVVSALVDVRKQVEPVVQAIAAFSKNKALAGLIVTTDTPPPSSKGINLATATNTTIPLTTLPRVEGDVVTFQAWLYEQDPKSPDKSRLIETKTQPLEIVAFGWGTAPNVGVAYATSNFTPAGQTSETKTFAPQVSWMLGYRPRGGIFSGEKVFGVGLHAVSFDLDKNNQLELGIGITVSTLADFVYVGYGTDLTLDNKKYWFIGTRLFQLAQKIGFKAAP